MNIDALAGKKECSGKVPEVVTLGDEKALSMMSKVRTGIFYPIDKPLRRDIQTDGGKTVKSVITGPM